MAEKKRGRPAGSLNKPKTTGSIFVTRFEKQIEGSAVTQKNTMGWINWGQKNNYANLLLDLYNQSPTHRACINFGVQSIVGNGVDLDAMQVDGTQVVPNYTESWDQIIRNISLDYMLYGSYGIEVIRNKDGKTFSFWHVPLDKVRWGEYDEDGQITEYWICQDWTATSKYQPIRIDAFDMRDENIIEKGKPYLYVYRQYSPTMTYYTQPHYQAGIKAIQSEIEYVNYDLKTTVNGFTPVGMLTLNDVETDEERQSVINNIQKMFQGTDAANSIMINFKSNVDETKPEFTPFTTNTGNINLYESANQRTISRILSSHQIPNASLIGMPDIGATGFASEADKLETAYQLYNKLTGNYNRMVVIKTLNQMFKMQGVDAEVIMKPLSFNDFKNDANVQERTTDKTDAQEEIIDDGEEKV
ncbi:MAG: hypothetical protein VZR53_12075 [Prevotella sp.]|nr:hypothetical protein [Prevotella sp.]